jgi:hypothetical protein
MVRRFGQAATDPGTAACNKDDIPGEFHSHFLLVLRVSGIGEHDT